ncbi:MAG TPA: helix-turn-helix domain-containing protein [Rhizobiaceae bacterium]|nr:helix-turn-helix domain-containing protein [Rhizobiaceae bacterium]
MAPTGFSTGNLSAAQQFDAWREWFWPVFTVLSQAPETIFRATNNVWDLNGLVVSCVSAPAAAVTRTRGNIARAPVDHWVLSCFRRGATIIQTPRALVKASPGVPYLWSLGETSQSERSEVERVQILLPRDMFQDIAPALDLSRGSVLETPLGRVLGDYMLSLEQWLPTMTPEGLRRFGPAIHSMIVACLAPSGERIEQASAEIRSFRADQVRKVVRMHLSSPSLGPDAICKMVGISRSSLYRLFEYHGGIMHYIQRQRLLHAYKVLSDPTNRLSISDLSEDLCFADASSFGRSFKREFGCSPGDVRALANGGEPLQPPRVRPLQTPDMPRFGDFLRG